MVPLSCDTFVVLPSATKDKQMIFGKNSDRPAGEVQDVIFVPRTKIEGLQQVIDHCCGYWCLCVLTILFSKQCTYIKIDAPKNGETYAVALSKPAWMWGAEMGANEHGVVIGNEAVWTKLLDSNEVPSNQLIGMDLLRLGLERATNATEALEVITTLLAKYGQDGSCSNSLPNFMYHNSFLIVDPREAWVLETAGRDWVAQKVTGAYRNISNVLSIGADFDRSSDTLKETAKNKGLWTEGEEFNFAKIFSDSTHSDGGRYEAGKKLLAEATANGQFNVSDMMSILRDKPSGICRGCSEAFPTMGSQVSALSPSSSGTLHWFTGTPDPQYSYFKPLIIGPGLVRASPKTLSSANPFAPHQLYVAHQKAYNKLRDSEDELHATMLKMESNFIDELYKMLPEGGEAIDRIEDLFHDSAEAEICLYKDIIA